MCRYKHPFSRCVVIRLVVGTTDVGDAELGRAGRRKPWSWRTTTVDGVQDECCRQTARPVRRQAESSSCRPLRAQTLPALVYSLQHHLLAGVHAAKLKRRRRGRRNSNQNCNELIRSAVCSVSNSSVLAVTRSLLTLIYCEPFTPDWTRSRLCQYASL